MSKKLEMYKCPVCGNIVELFFAGGGTLSCCGKPMEYLMEKEADSSTEKHVPYIEELEDGYHIRIGETVDHPMTEEHHIQWIELIANDNIYRKELHPNEKPEVTFKITKGSDVTVREYCNLHGLWKNKK